jgi:hypothetical protein
MYVVPLGGRSDIIVGLDFLRAHTLRVSARHRSTLVGTFTPVPNPAGRVSPEAGGEVDDRHTTFTVHVPRPASPVIMRLDLLNFTTFQYAADDDAASGHADPRRSAGLFSRSTPVAIAPDVPPPCTSHRVVLFDSLSRPSPPDGLTSFGLVSGTPRSEGGGWM